MRHLVGSSLLSGLAAGLLLGCSLSTIGGMDPVEGGKCDVAMQSKTAADGCTQCVCDGATWDCNGDACMAGCSAGDKKAAADGCNTCSCGMDGKWSCTTNAKCPAPGSECQPGDTKLRDDGCARCECDMSGQWACPDIACATCTPGEMTMSSCLSCTCNAEGNNWECSGTFDGPGCSESQVCKPGETMPDDTMCKTCTCSEDGTQWNCMPSMGEGCGGSKCTPGEVIPSADGCNTCTCGADGSLACTMKACEECPPELDDNGMCPPQMIFAQNPMTKACCGYSSKCTAPAGWDLFTTPACLPEMTVCASGKADCDGDPANGCETNVMTSAQNCGACGSVCMAVGGTGTCDQGKCVTPEQQTCFYGGVEYAPGATFPSRDGCNSCSCILDMKSVPSVACTERACQCDPTTDTYRKYVVTDPTKCELTDFMCAENTTPFANDCGCGCQQSLDCPNVFDCTPDPKTMKSNCDPALEARCPYSTYAPSGVR
jgi:hypothetical protein